MKKFNRYQDIVISYNAQRESWYPNLEALGMVPPRPDVHNQSGSHRRSQGGFRALAEPR